MYHEQPCVNVQVEPRRSITKKSNLAHLLSLRATFHTRGGGGYCHIWAIWAIWVCAAGKGIVFKQFTLG